MARSCTQCGRKLEADQRSFCGEMCSTTNFVMFERSERLLAENRDWDEQEEFFDGERQSIQKSSTGSWPSTDAEAVEAGFGVGEPTLAASADREPGGPESRNLAPTVPTIINASVEEIGDGFEFDANDFDDGTTECERVQAMERHCGVAIERATCRHREAEGGAVELAVTAEVSRVSEPEPSNPLLPILLIVAAQDADGAFLGTKKVPMHAWQEWPPLMIVGDVVLTVSEVPERVRVYPAYS